MSVGGEPVGGMRLSRLDRLMIGAGAGSLVAWTAVAVGVISAPTPSAWRIALVVGLLAASQVVAPAARDRTDLLAFPRADAALVVGFVLVGPRWFILLALPALLGLHLLLRRGWWASAFNAASVALAGTAAYAALLDPDGGPVAPTDLRDVLRLAAAVLVFGAVSISVSAVAAAALQNATLRPILDGAVRRACGDSLGHLAVAGGVLLLVDAQAPAVVTMPFALTAVLVVWRGYQSARRERNLWQQLDTASRELHQLEESDVAEAALRRARQLFGADAAELVLDADGRRPPRTYLLRADGSFVCRPGSAQRGDGAGQPRGLLSSRARAARMLESPLTGPQGDIGLLRITFSTAARLSARERHILSTFAHTVATTVLNAGLYDDVRAEASRHAHEASHDRLTGLANRVLLQERTALAVAQQHDLTTALFLVDLDHFKEINDTLGHVAGDFLLQRVADRLHSLSRPGDLVARLGGDEFGVLLTGLLSPEDVPAAAEHILGLLAEPVDYEGLRLSVEGSVGVACYPADAPDADELLRRADVAMYQAKLDRGSWIRYDVDRDDSSLHRLALVAQLREALSSGEIVVHFQPQADLRTGEIIGVEALARWNHPTRGLLMPAEFIGVAEQSGLVRPFTQRILDIAVAECARWAALGRPITVAVNLAARSLLDRQLPQDVAAVLARHSLPPDRLVLEITESTATSELEVVEEVLGRLRRLGVALSVDDFGTGYSSLAFLQRTAVNELKVDRSFVVGMLGSDSDLALVRTTIQLAHSLGARAVAEGVEDPQVAEALRELGCDLAQGYWLSRPVPGKELRVLLGVDPLGAAAPMSLPEPRLEPDLPVLHLRVVEG